MRVSLRFCSARFCSRLTQTPDPHALLLHLCVLYSMSHGLLFFLGPVAPRKERADMDHPQIYAYHQIYVESLEWAYDAYFIEQACTETSKLSSPTSCAWTNGKGQQIDSRLQAPHEHNTQQSVVVGACCRQEETYPFKLKNQ